VRARDDRAAAVQASVRQARYTSPCVPSIRASAPDVAASTSQAAPTGHSSDRRRCGFSARRRGALRAWREVAAAGLNGHRLAGGHGGSSQTRNERPQAGVRLSRALVLPREDPVDGQRFLERSSDGCDRVRTRCPSGPQSPLTRVSGRSALAARRARTTFGWHEPRNHRGLGRRKGNRMPAGSGADPRGGWHCEKRPPLRSRRTP
jgi:hypothetical protein